LEPNIVSSFELSGMAGAGASAGERLFAAAAAQWARLQALGPQVLALNVGLTAAVVIVGALLIWGLNNGLSASLRFIPGLSKSERKAQATRLLGLTSTVLSFIVGLLGLYLIVELWGFDPLAWTATGWGARLAATAWALLVVILATAVALEAASLFLHYAMARLTTRSGADPRRVAQLNTLGPIFRSALQITILVIAIMTVLGEVGVQIAPILAGAGVAGIAVGFGAQTLVKDFFTGFFLIIEDIVAVGDVVQIQAFNGTVEEMTLRTIRLRDFDGTLHIMPYGEAQIIHNMTKTFAYAAFDSWVRADTDVAKAIALMREADVTLRKDPAIERLITGPVEIVGVDAMTDQGVLIKGRIRTLPQERWTVLRAYNEKLKMAYDAAGIGLGHKV
jgi:small conductance mechanosensitive channel